MALVAAVAACSRDNDPYRDWKPGKLLDEGERLIRANDLDAADKVLRKGLERAQKAGLGEDKTRGFLVRLLYIAAARENLPEAEALFARMGGISNPQSMDVRVATQILVSQVRAGKSVQARASAERLAARLAANPPADDDEKAYYVVGWIVIDRLRTANVEIVRAKEASTQAVASLGHLAESYAHRRPLPPGLRRWLTRYVDHLYESERSLVAQRVADIVERIDQVTPPSDEKPCLELDPLFPQLGCLADWPDK